MTNDSRGIADWYLQRQADDQARRAEIAARYGLGPAATLEELLARMDPADREAIEELASHKPLPAPEEMGFCAVALTGAPHADTAFRLKGTSNCVAWIPSAALAEVRGCAYSSANQQWLYSGGGTLTVESATDYCLAGDGGGGDVYMTACTASNSQLWNGP